VIGNEVERGELMMAIRETEWDCSNESKSSRRQLWAKEDPATERMAKKVGVLVLVVSEKKLISDLSCF
jgi:hypothetical protein